ncbi:MAG: sulfotransferase [Parvularcula sp.]|jgi:hypothetical protein|nr:sulfotransferase [Parvularcula sp.]
MTRTLIVTGCPRSGTTALTKLLNAHPAILLGDERFYWRFEHGLIEPDDFKRSRFIDVRKEDRHWEEGRAPFPKDPEGAEWDGLSYVGDKYPPLWRVWPTLAGRLPAARLLFILRNPVSVAMSYRARKEDPSDPWSFDAFAGLKEWNEGVSAMNSALSSGIDADLVLYEDVFGPQGDPALPFDLLGLDAAEALGRAEGILERARERFAEPTACDEAMLAAIAKRADWEGYRHLVERRARRPGHLARANDELTIHKENRTS